MPDLCEHHADVMAPLESPGAYPHLRSDGHVAEIRSALARQCARCLGVAETRDLAREREG